MSSQPTDPAAILDGATEPPPEAVPWTEVPAYRVMRNPDGRLWRDKMGMLHVEVNEPAAPAGATPPASDDENYTWEHDVSHTWDQKMAEQVSALAAALGVLAARLQEMDPAIFGGILDEWRRRNPTLFPMHADHAGRDAAPQQVGAVDPADAGSAGGGGAAS